MKILVTGLIIGILFIGCGFSIGLIHEGITNYKSDKVQKIRDNLTEPTGIDNVILGYNSKESSNDISNTYTAKEPGTMIYDQNGLYGIIDENGVLIKNEETIENYPTVYVGDIPKSMNYNDFRKHISQICPIAMGYMADGECEEKISYFPNDFNGIGFYNEVVIK